MSSTETREREPLDLPRDELLTRARQAAFDLSVKGATNIEVYFKFVCEACGARVCLEEPNKLYERGRCCVCGHSTEIRQGGFALLFEPAGGSGEDGR